MRPRLLLYTPHQQDFSLVCRIRCTIRGSKWRPRKILQNGGPYAFNGLHTTDEAQCTYRLKHSRLAFNSPSSSARCSDFEKANCLFTSVTNPHLEPKPYYSAQRLLMSATWGLHKNSFPSLAVTRNARSTNQSRQHCLSESKD